MTSDRRQFLRAATLGASFGPLAHRARAEQGRPPSPESNALAHALARLRRKTCLKVERLETFTRGTDLSFVRLRTDDGSEGVGQIAPFDADVSATILHRKVAPHVLGQDPGDFEAIADACVERNYKFPWSFVCRALAGVDTALWDLLGKRHKKGVCELLGGKPRPIAVYGSSMRRDIRP